MKIARIFILIGVICVFSVSECNNIDPDKTAIINASEIDVISPIINVSTNTIQIFSNLSITQIKKDLELEIPEIQKYNVSEETLKNIRSLVIDYIESHDGFVKKALVEAVCQSVRLKFGIPTCISKPMVSYMVDQYLL